MTTLIAGLAIIALSFGFIAPTASAHHNSPMYDTIEENENFDNMDMHEAAIDALADNVADTDSSGNENMELDDTGDMPEITITTANDSAVQDGNR